MRLPALTLLLSAALLLAGCPQTPPAPPAAESTPLAAAAPPPSLPGEVDYRCETDADCAIKDVGNCCGYYPACVNKDSPTFPEQVKAKCEAEGTMSVCGFPELAGCRCVDNRCEGIRAETDTLPLQ